MKENCNKQSGKGQKTSTVSQGQDKTNQAEQQNEASEKARKNKKQKLYQAKQYHNRQKSNTLASGTNTTPAIKKTGQNQGQNRGQNHDISEVTCYNCNKKAHYAKSCTKTKN